VLSIPETLKVSQAEEIVDGLTLHYQARIEEPIIEDKEEHAEGQPRLSFPKVSEAFIPQSYKVLRQNVKERRLEDEGTWKDLERRSDLGAFILSYLSSPYSTETPFVILGHPGSGKSLLTTILSAQLMSKHYTAIRVPLREVDSEAGIVDQIEEQIGRITNLKQDSWAKISGAFKNNPPLVILDGYDELLQASGKVFSGYLKDVQNFQKNEAEQGRPVRVIVTSRITLIDKATVPLGSTILRLLEFDKRQRERWISIWNRANANYFQEAEVDPFKLPDEDDSDSAKVLSLAEQPLLLLMLALYDSEENKLRNSKSLDRTVLYESLLHRFVEREQGKRKEFEDLSQSDKKKELDTDMQRLGVAAIGMYNRRKLHILSPELNEDLKFFNLERELVVVSGRPLTQADLLLGSFFFVHKSKAQQKAGATELHEEATAFEFLHNTFGEFLTADFILRQAFAEVEALRAFKEQEVLRAQLEQKLGDADGFSRAWYASLVYTPLFTRPVVLEMIREWIAHMLQRKQLSRKDFISLLDVIILNQIRRLLSKRDMPSIMRKEAAQEGYRAPFGDHPLLGHIAIYSINLILLRAIVSKDPFVFDENSIASHEDGARAWDQLIYIWRSWFAIDNLNGITAVIRADRNQSQISVSSKDTLRVSESQNRLETFLNISISLGDNLSSGLTGLLLYEPTRDNQLNLSDIASRLSSESIDLGLTVMIKRLFSNELAVSESNVAEFMELAAETLNMALREDKEQEVDQIIRSIRRGLKRAFWIFYPRKRTHRFYGFRPVSELFRHFFHPRNLEEIAHRNPDAALSLIHLAREFGAEWELVHYREDFFEQLFHPRYIEDLAQRRPEKLPSYIQLIREFRGGRSMGPYGEEFLERTLRSSYLREIIERSPEAALDLIQLAREVAGARWVERYGEEFFEQTFHPHYLEELIHRYPEAAIGFIQLAREAGGKKWAKRFGEEFFERAFHSPYLRELSERNPEAALGLLQLAHEIGGKKWVERYGEEFFERAFRPRYIEQLIYRSPEEALSFLQLARQTGRYDWVERYEDEFLERVFNPTSLQRIIIHKPAIFVELLRFIHTFNLQRHTEALLQSLTEFLNTPHKVELFKKRVTIDALQELQWLMQIATDGKLDRVLQPILSDRLVH
jgi:hypothetical protein